MKRFILFTLAILISGLIRVTADVPSWVRNEEKLQVSNIVVDGKPIDFNGYIYAKYHIYGLLSELHLIMHNEKTDRTQYIVKMPVICTFLEQNEAGEMIGKDLDGNLVAHCVLPQIGEGVCGLIFTQEGKQIVVYFNTNKKIK